MVQSELAGFLPLLYGKFALELANLPENLHGKKYHTSMSGHEMYFVYLRKLNLLKYSFILSQWYPELHDPASPFDTPGRHQVLDSQGGVLHDGGHGPDPQKG